MLPASAALQALIAKWRKTATEIDGYAHAESMFAHQMRICADELEAALQGIAIPPEVKE